MQYLGRGLTPEHSWKHLALLIVLYPGHGLGGELVPIRLQRGRGCEFGHRLRQQPGSLCSKAPQCHFRRRAGVSGVGGVGYLYMGGKGIGAKGCRKQPKLTEGSDEIGVIVSIIKRASSEHHTAVAPNAADSWHLKDMPSADDSG